MNPFDQFDTASNPFDQFDGPAPKKTGQAANADFLRAEMQNADPFTRNLAGAGVALSDTWEGLKEWFGMGDKARIDANKVIADEAPVGNIVGNVALTAIPFGMVGNSVRGAAAVGAGVGALQPTGKEFGWDMLAAKAKNAAIDATLAGGGQVVANQAGKYFAGKMADMAADKLKNAPRDETLRAAQELGLVVPPSSVNPSWWNTTKEGVAGKIATAQDASNRNAEKFGEILRREVLLAPEAPLTSESMKQARKAAHGWGYEPVVQSGVRTSTDDAYRAAMDAIASKYEIAAKDFPGMAPDDVSKLILGTGKTVKQPVPGAEVAVGGLRNVREFGADTGLKQSQILRDAAKDAFAAGNSELGRARREAAKAIEDQIERALLTEGKQGDHMLQEFRKSRQLMAKSFDIEDAIIEGGGEANMRVLARKFQNHPERMSGDLKAAAAFANNFPRASQSTAQVAGPGVSKLNSLAALLLGGGGHGVGGPLLGAAGAAAPFVVPPLVRKQLLGARSQNELLNMMYQLGLVDRLTGRVLDHAPVGLTVLGSEAFTQ